MNNCHRFLPSKHYAVIGAPQCKAGGPETKSVADTPSIVRKAGLIEIIKACDAAVTDYGDAFEPDYINDYNQSEYNKYDEINQDGTLSLAVPNWPSLAITTEKLYIKTMEAIDDQRIPLIIGGDHGVATGSISAALSKYPDLAVLWIDAHTDINTPLTSVHGNYHGMPVAHVTGILNAKGFDWIKKVPKLNPKKIAYIGIRAMYQVDKDILDEYQIPYYTMHDVCRLGIGKVIEEAVNKIDPEGTSPLHLSFDVDCCEPCVAPGTAGNVEGGLSYAEALYICHYANKTDRLVSMDFVELNTEIDMPSTFNFQSRLPLAKETNQTTRLYLKLISEAVMGRGIQTVRFRKPMFAP